VSDKQALLKALESLPDTANWDQIIDKLLDVVARRGSAADFARLYRTQFTAEHLAEYLNPKVEFSLADVLAELESRVPTEAK
jgi:hypothetical protein